MPAWYNSSALVNSCKQNPIFLPARLLSHLLVVHNLGVQCPRLNTLGELLSGFFEPLEDGIDGSMIPYSRGCPVVCVKLLDVSHWEVGLKAYGFTEIHYSFVRLVYQQMNLKG